MCIRLQSSVVMRGTGSPKRVLFVRALPLRGTHRLLDVVIDDRR
jgi:hypothetical protein